MITIPYFQFAHPLEIALVVCTSIGLYLSFYVLYRAVRRMRNIHAEKVNGFLQDRALFDMMREGVKVLMHGTAWLGGVAMLFIPHSEMPQMRFSITVFILLALEMILSSAIAFIAIRRHDRRFFKTNFKRRFTDPHPVEEERSELSQTGGDAASSAQITADSARQTASAARITADIAQDAADNALEDRIEGNKNDHPAA